QGNGDDAGARPFALRDPATRDGIGLKPGALLVREWSGRLERVVVLDKGFAWNGTTYGSLSQIAKAMTGTNWNGHRFFGLRTAGSTVGRTTGRRGREGAAAISDVSDSASLPTRRPSAIVEITSEATVDSDDEVRAALPLAAS
ncbi:MAG: DUF2924 domain-containing protein, partial [Hyphomicrobiales bacterium]|nr:DUF2924 domain-containing protein [Hyphomicrobiales bacterium]MBV8662301.1 DUF2924 domain-containing protein [Hyphomicrobiales bacterium]